MNMNVEPQEINFIIDAKEGLEWGSLMRGELLSLTTQSGRLLAKGVVEGFTLEMVAEDKMKITLRLRTDVLEVK